MNFDFPNKKKNPREVLTPQMKIYDQLGIDWHPYIMFFQKPNFNSNIVNTDTFGFRYSIINNKKFSPTTFSESNQDEISFVVGSSAAFGVGASCDNCTISSKLSSLNNEYFLNFGCRAHVSSQELILFNHIAPKFKNVKNVVIFSGLNDLYLSFMKDFSSELGPFFFSKQFSHGMNKQFFSKKRLIMKAFLEPLYKNSIDYKYIQLKDLLKVLVSNRKNLEIESKKDIPHFDINYTINKLRKNLFIWKKLSQSFPFKLIFVLQPTLDWISKVQSVEESTLFNYLNQQEDEVRIREVLSKETYLSYSKELRKLCSELGISFFDSNCALKSKISKEEWIFVDRGGHMTDQGYAIVSAYINEILQNFN